MFDYTGWIVRSAAGHDKGDLMCVIGTQEDRLLLADGKRRKIAAPKHKKLGHVSVLNRGSFEHATIRKIQSGEVVTDRMLRAALAAFRDELEV